MRHLTFVTEGERWVTVEVRDLVMAGWTGRDAGAIERHIAELEALGVARPRSTPTFYRVGSNLLTTERNIEVVGDDSSGEVEFVLVSTTEGQFVGVGSDHTDRKVEKYRVTISKQVCPKAISPELWRMEQVRDHWDTLVLRSWLTSGGKRKLYQEGSVNTVLEPSQLIQRYQSRDGTLPTGTVMFCGTLPTLGPITGGELFEIELADPVRTRSLKHAYTTRTLACAD